jgi:hypothetical protein
MRAPAFKKWCRCHPVQRDAARIFIKRADVAEHRLWLRAGNGTKPPYGEIHRVARALGVQVHSQALCWGWSDSKEYVGEIDKIEEYFSDKVLTLESLERLTNSIPTPSTQPCLLVRRAYYVLLARAARSWFVLLARSTQHAAEYLRCYFGLARNWYATLGARIQSWSEGHTTYHMMC